VRIIVTGGNGFLGRAVVRRLREADHFVFVPRSREYDLRTPDGIRRALFGDPEIIIHLAAAVGGIGANEAHPARFLYDNAVMGMQLMEQARLQGVDKFVTIGTACEFPADAPLPLREDGIWDGYPAPETAPYGLAKRMLLAQGQAYRMEYGFDAVHLIPTNLYGPGDNFDRETSHVIPALISRFSEATRQGMPSVKCWGSGTATREFLYVDDAAAAIVAATFAYSAAEPVNIGTGIETPLADVAQHIADAYGYTGAIIWDEMRPDGVSRRWMDVSRAEKAFGFRAETPLDEGLKRTIEWYEQ
jgi:GDP-L-fucose synthase